jgi:hypothetical protein
MSGQIIVADGPEDAAVTVVVPVDEFGARQRVGKGFRYVRVDAVPVAAIILLSGEHGGSRIPPSYSLQTTDLRTTTGFIDVDALPDAAVGTAVAPGLVLRRKPDDDRPFTLDAVSVTL